MKKSLIKAFTLIELIIVISIITLITSSSVFYFLDFIKNQEIKQRVELISNNFDDLDKDIKKYKIFDYQINLNTTSLSGGYITYLNNFDINQNQTLNNFNGPIRNNGINTETGIIKIFKQRKMFKVDTLTGGTNYVFNFNTEPYYKIKSTLSGETLNEILINYYSPENVNIKQNNLLHLININTKKDKSGTPYSSLIIKNIGGVKTFYNLSSEINNNDIYLFFENSGKEKLLKISK